MATITTRTGRTAEVMPHVDLDDVIGLDNEGRIVVKGFDGSEYCFGLTLCCQAYDKGTGDGVVCRNCYGMDDVGNYLFRDQETGEIRGLDLRV